MNNLFKSKLLKQLSTTLLISLLVCVVTGPSGSPTAPASGFTGSFNSKSSFFGLFGAPRWTIFVFLGLLIFAAYRVKANYSNYISKITDKALFIPRKITRHQSTRRVSIGALLVISLILPKIVTDHFWQTVLVSQIAIYILLALGLNIVTGFAGLLDLGFVAFYAVGAYATAWATGALPLPALFGVHIDPFFAIPVAIGFTMIAGIILGIPTLRLRGDYLAIVTLGFGEIITLFANNLYGITGGALGSNQIPHFAINLGPIKYAWGLAPVPYYYLTLVFVVIFIIIFSSLEHSRVGRSWTAIREDEVAAESVGINPLKYKVMAFAIGAASAGFAGVITAAQTNFINPASFTLYVSINVLVLVIFGGMGSIAGVVFGAVFIQAVSMYLIHTPPSGYQPADLYIYIGALLVVMMIFRPEGLIPAKRRGRSTAHANVQLTEGN